MESMLHNGEKDIFDWIVNDNDIAAIMNTSALQQGSINQCHFVGVKLKRMYKHHKRC